MVRVKAEPTRRFSAKKLDSIPPFNFRSYWDKEVRDVVKLCDLVEKVKTPEIAQATKNYILVRLTGIIENELRACVPKLIDDFQISPSQILGKGQDVVDMHIDRLEDYRGKNVTKGSVICLQFQLTNARSVNDLFSGMNNVEDFFKWHGEILNMTSKIKVVKQVGNLRNELIHQLEPVKEEPNKLKEKMIGMDGFVRSAYIITYINQAIERKYDDKEIKKYIKKYLKNNISLTEFKDITKKHTKTILSLKKLDKKIEKIERRLTKLGK